MGKIIFNGTEIKQKLDSVVADSPNPIANSAVWEELHNNSNLTTSTKDVPQAINLIKSQLDSLSGTVKVIVSATKPDTTTVYTPSMYYVGPRTGTTSTYDIYLYTKDDSGNIIETSLGESSVSLDGYLKETDVVNDVTTGGDTKPLSATQGKLLEDNKEDVANKITTISSSSTDEQYPTAKTVYGYSEALANKTTSISSTSTDTQYPSAKAVNTLVDDTKADYLPLAGGTMTGAIKLPTGNSSSLVTTTNYSVLNIDGGTAFDNGASISLWGKSNVTRPGNFQIFAHSTSAVKALEGAADGTLTWGDNNVCTDKVTTATDSTSGLTFYKCGRIVTVDVIGCKTFAAGEQRSIGTVPSGYEPYVEVSLTNTWNAYGSSTATRPQFWITTAGDIRLGSNCALVSNQMRGSTTYIAKS